MWCEYEKYMLIFLQRKLSIVVAYTCKYIKFQLKLAQNCVLPQKMFQFPSSIAKFGRV